jgi:hypothetical protein
MIRSPLAPGNITFLENTIPDTTPIPGKKPANGTKNRAWRETSSAATQKKKNRADLPSSVSRQSPATSRTVPESAADAPQRRHHRPTDKLPILPYRAMQKHAAR